MRTLIRKCMCILSLCSKYWISVDRELSKWHFFLSDPSTTYSTTRQQSGLPCPGKYLRLCPYKITGLLRQKKNMALMKEQIKAPEKI